MTTAINPTTSVQIGVDPGFTPSRTPNRSGRQRRRTGAGGEARDHQIVQRQRERQHPARRDRGQDPAASVTPMNARAGPQPRSIAASSRLRSSAPSRDCTTTATKHRVNVVCAIVTVQKPRSAFSATNNSSSDRPVDDFGHHQRRIEHAGKQRAAPKAPGRATALSRPACRAASRSLADTVATRKLIHAASSIGAVVKNSEYQRSEPAAHTVTSREALNE